MSDILTASYDILSIKTILITFIHLLSANISAITTKKEKAQKKIYRKKMNKQGEFFE